MASGITVVGIPAMIGILQQIREAYFQNAAYVVGASAPYAPFVEYGTWKSPAQPFIGPGVQDAQANFNSIASANQGSIKDIVKGMAEFAAERARQYVPVLTGFLRSTIGTFEA